MQDAQMAKVTTPSSKIFLKMLRFFIILIPPADALSVSVLAVKVSPPPPTHDIM
jgi:hypothetical protein